jgi:hypothetical protein
MNETLKMFATGFVGAVTAFVLFVGVGALADGNPATDGVPRTIHYSGTLERDGAATNGAATMVFRVYDGSSEVWSETQAVQVYAGRFSVLLGSTTLVSAKNLETAINNADDLYLGITLKTDQGDVVLTNRQRFTPAPFALWSTAATNFKVAGEVTQRLTVNGGDVTDALDGFTLRLKNGNQTLVADGNEIDSNDTLYLNSNSKGGVVTGGNLRMKGYDFTIVPNDPAPRGDGGRALVHYAGDTLVVNFESDFAGGTKVDSNLNVTGTFESGKMSCRDGCADVQWVEPPGGMAFGDWRGRRYCPARFYVCGMEQKVEGDQGSGGDDTAVNSVAMLCCPF